MVWWYWIVPVVVSVVWLFHGLASWLHPQRIRLSGWLVLAGLPVVTVVFYVAAGLAHNTPSGPYNPLPRTGIHDWRTRLILVVGELLLAWIVVLLLEPVLALIRELRGRTL